MTDRDCANCKHHTEDGCSSWDCEYEPTDLISRADAIEAVKETKPIVRSTERNWGKMIAEQHSKELVKALKALPSADAVDVAHDIPEYCSWSQTYTNMVQSAMSKASANAVQADDRLELDKIYCSPLIAENVEIVVRCKDCKNYSVEGETTQFGWCNALEMPIDEQSFCSYGERREP